MHMDLAMDFTAFVMPAAELVVTCTIALFATIRAAHCATQAIFQITIIDL